MRAGLEEDMLESAVSFYAEAMPLLKKYGQRGAFKTVAMESELVAAEISGTLKKRLAERKDDTEQCVLLLRKLGEGDDTLQVLNLGVEPWVYWSPEMPDILSHWVK
jgi:hypothetical protein